MTNYNDLPKSITRIIDDIVDRLDDETADCLASDYAYYLTDEADIRECLNNFESNYSSRSIGFIPHDDLTGKEIREALSNDDLLWSLIKNSSEVIALNDIYTQWNEINSLIMGEYDYEIDPTDYPDLAAALAAEGLDQDSILAYGRPCERLILKLDPKAFLEALDLELTPKINRSSIKLVRA